MSEIHGFYPVQICESRYSGTYCGGRWVLMAGHMYPRQTDAFGGYIDCMDFWMHVEEEGPVIEMSGPRGTTGVYVAAGNDVKQLIDDARQHIRDHSTYTLHCMACDIEYEADLPWSSCPTCHEEPSTTPQTVEYDQ